MSKITGPPIFFLYFRSIMSSVNDSPFVEKTDPDEFLQKAKHIVVEHYNSAPTVNRDLLQTITLEDVYIVWFAKTLQNWKALVSTTVPDGLYYELTYNGDKTETYLDVYAKISNNAVTDEDLAKTNF